MTKEQFIKELVEKGKVVEPGKFTAVLIPAANRKKVHGKGKDLPPRHKWRVRITASGHLKERINRMMSEKLSYSQDNVV